MLCRLKVSYLTTTDEILPTPPKRGRRPEDLPAALTAISLIGIIVLTAMHTVVPDALTTVALLSVGATAGIAAPKSGTPPAP